MAGLFPRFTNAMRKIAEAAALAKRISAALRATAGRIHADQVSSGGGITRATTAAGGRSKGKSGGQSSTSAGNADILRAATAAARAAGRARTIPESSGGGGPDVLDAIAAKAGPRGDVVKAMLRPAGKPVGTIQKELEAAAKLLRQFGYAVESPGGGQPGQKPGQSGLSGSIRPATPEPADEHFEEAGPEFGQYRVGGRLYNFQPDDPIITGAMIPVTSSNVHSIGFIWNHKSPMKGTLKVRFLGTNRNQSPQTRGGKGPIYHYFGVHPAIFQSFRDAASKGKFVWDRLRVRGTVSGHQYPYELTKLQADGYVPRQATSRDLGSNGNYREGFVPRTVRGTNGKVYSSVLQEEWLSRVKNRNNPPPHVIAGRGAPNRGTPNRGSPNRGRPKKP